MQIARVADIPVRLHWSFLLLAALYATSTYAASGAGKLVEGVILSVALFGSVVLHELGHALAARYFGIRTAHITLYPFGGVAALQSMPRSSGQELIVAIAGPAVNAALVSVFLPLAVWNGHFVFVALAAINVVMGVFNLLPAFPMDGGRVLRALLAIPMGFLGATRVAMRVGVVFAGLFVIAGVATWTPSLVLVGAFLIFANWMERRRLMAALRRFRRPALRRRVVFVSGPP